MTLEDVAVVDAAADLTDLEGHVTLHEAVDVVDGLGDCV